jgi:hypothetical protein
MAILAYGVIFYTFVIYLNVFTACLKFILYNEEAILVSNLMLNERGD